MTVDLEHYQRSLVALTDARAVIGKVRGCMDAWPDLYRLARTTAAEYLHKQTGKRMDPDRVWWHTFADAVSAPTFTGWRHRQAPQQSMTFTQLLIRRFDDGFQLAPDTLPLYGGFYRQGVGADEYGAANEVRLNAGKVMGDLWAMDFAALLSQRTERFWREHGSDFTLLAKVRFIAATEQGLKQGALTSLDRGRLLQWLGLGEEALTLKALQGALQRDVFHVRHYLASAGAHLITLRADDGRIVLYCPGTDWPLRAFANLGDLVHWVSGQARTDQGFEALLRISPQLDNDRRQAAMADWLERMGPVEAPGWPLGIGREVSGDLFAELCAWAKVDLAASHAQVVTNADLRKTAWRGYLGAFIHVFGSSAVLAWPLALVILGAAVARLSLDIDAAVRAHSVHERTEAIIAAISDAVAGVFAIIDVGLGAKSLSFKAPPHEQAPATLITQPAGRVNDELQSLVGNRIVPEPSSEPGLLDGISVDDDGSTWIEMNDLGIRVRYSPEAESWLASDDEDPYAFLPNIPVRIVEMEGRTWTTVEPPQPVKGAAETIEPMASAFWDTYMQESPELSLQVSATQLEAQRRTLAAADLPGPSASNPLLANPQNFRHLLKAGKPWYSWFEADEFENDYVFAYTAELTQANSVLRYGHADPARLAYLQTLFDALEQLPRSDAVRLWRGGSAPRATGGAHLRSGALHEGDVLVTTDLVSFTENPYALREFVAALQPRGLDHVHVFDDSSVVYELIGKGMHSGVPIGPMSQAPMEVEVVFTPGRYLRIESIRDVRGSQYRFLKVRLREIEKPLTGPFYEMRDGALFDREAYLRRVGDEALVERFFPQPGDGEAEEAAPLQR